MTTRAQTGSAASPGQPLVTVIVTNFNYGDYIKRALRSVEAQTYRPIEVVVVDDGSADNSLDEIHQWIGQSGLPAVVVAKQTNEGVGAALSDGLAQASGDFVAILDADDEFYPTKLEKQVPLLSDGAAVAVYSEVDIVDASGRTLPGATSVPAEQPSGDVREPLVRLGTFAATNSALIRGASLRRVGFRRDMRLSQDFAMWLGLSQLGQIKFEEMTVGRVWEHPRSIRASSNQVLRHVYRIELLASVWASRDLRPALRRRLARVCWSLGKARSRDGFRATMRAVRTCRSPLLLGYYAAGFLRSLFRNS